MLRKLRTSKVLAFSVAYLLFANQVFAHGGIFGPGALIKEDVGKWALRNTTAAGNEIRVYGTYTDAANYNRGFMRMTSTGKLEIGREYAGTGASNDIFIDIPGINGEFIIKQNGSSQWTFGSAGLGLGLAPVSANRSFYFGKHNRQMFITYSASYLGANIKTLTESAATDFVRLQVSNGEACSGHFDYTIRASDATNTQAKTGQLFFSFVADAAGTVTAAALSDTNTANPVSAGTLTNTFTQTTGAGTLTFSANAVSSLAQTTLDLKYQLVAPTTSVSCYPTVL